MLPLVTVLTLRSQIRSTLAHSLETCCWLYII